MAPPTLRPRKPAAPAAPSAHANPAKPSSKGKKRKLELDDDPSSSPPSSSSSSSSSSSTAAAAAPGDLKVLRDFSKSVVRLEACVTGDLEDLTRAISQSLTALVGCDAVAVYQVDKANHVGKLRKLQNLKAGEKEAEDGEREEEVKGGFVQETVRTRMSQWYSADSPSANQKWDIISANQNPTNTPVKLERFFCFPAIEEETNQLLLCIVLARKSQDFTKKEADLCHALSKHVALSFKNVQRNIFINSIVVEMLQELNVDKLLKKILGYATALVDCDRCSIFLVDEEQQELYSRVFSLDNDGPQIEEVRFPKTSGIAGHVAMTGQALLISDAYQDPRFNRGVDSKTGYKTRNILTIPLLSNQKVIGVAQLINKLSFHSFTQHDLKSAEIFAHFVGLAISNAKLYDNSFKSEQRLKVAMDVIAYHTTPPADQVEALASAQIPSAADLPGFHTFFWDTQSCPIEQTPVLVLKMFHDLGFVKKFSIPHRSLCHFILSVIGGYREVPYHNWRHAFSVAHQMYAIAMVVPLDRYLYSHEILGLFVALLCHDIDHRGRNNAFQLITGDAMAKGYAASFLEYHHFNFAAAILTAEHNNILQNVSQEIYKEVIEQMKFVILATDLLTHFKTREKFRQELLGNRAAYNKENEHHRKLLCETIVTCCDISSAAMPFPINSAITKTIYEEFFQQGDDERAMGRQPNPNMDREKANIPQLQLSFLDHIASVAFRNLANFFPELQTLLDTLLENRKKWEDSKESTTKENSGPVLLPTH